MPAPGAGEVLIKVAAAGVNRPDVLQRRGRYPPPPGASDIPGLEVPGTIEAVGAGRARLARRRRGLRAASPAAATPSTACAPAPQCLPVPRGIDVVEAAAIPETFFTVWTNVFERGRLAGGRVDSGSRRLERHRHDRDPARAGVRRARVRDRRIGGEVRRLRAARRRARDQLSRRRISSPSSQARPAAAASTSILDMVGGDYLPRNIDALAIEGRLVQIATLRRRARPRSTSLTDHAAAPDDHRLDAAPAVGRREGRDRRARVREHVWPLLESGAVKPIVHATFPLRDAAEAHRVMESSAHIGKLVLVT